MLRTRVITAVVLLVVLLSVLYSQSYPFFVVVTAAFFGAAAWESFRLYRNEYPIPVALMWTAAFALIVFKDGLAGAPLLSAISVAIWTVRLVPSLRFGLPKFDALGNRLLSGLYGISLLGCFIAIVAMYLRSPLYLLSVMALVWIADIGAYFAGKAFGKRKLAPSISPGKSWEGALGGWIAVLVLAAISTAFPNLQGTFMPQVLMHWGWGGFILVATLVVAASISGDLFESQLKRRAGMKDSSNLLPGHGGVLDRIDALIPVLPLAFLLGFKF